MEGIRCAVCGKEKEEEFFQSNVDENVFVCSMNCAKEYESQLPYRGKPVQHYSRITGYYQNVSGWNEGKRAELSDRNRYCVDLE